MANNPRYLIMLLAFVAAATPAASATYCDFLGNQLSRVSNQARQNPESLMRQLRAAQSSAGQYGCSFRFFGPPPPPICRRVSARIAQLRAQLSDGRGAGGNAFAFKRQQILSDMEQNGCAVRQPRPKSWSRAPEAGTYRTLCVRTCDGYFFPISYSVSRSRLKVDEAVCRGVYPKGAAELFITRSDQESDRTRIVSSSVLSSAIRAGLPGFKLVRKLFEDAVGEYVGTHQRVLVTGVSSGLELSDSPGGPSQQLPRRRPFPVSSVRQIQAAPVLPWLGWGGFLSFAPIPFSARCWEPSDAP